MSVFVGLAGVAPIFRNASSKSVAADESTNYPRNGESGNILYVNGSSTYFNTGEADLAVYYFNSESDNAWSDKVSYRCFGDILRVMIPYKDGVRKTWAKYIVCRYNPAMDPASNGWDGVYNKTEDISCSSMMYAQNTVNITGYSDGKMTYSFSSNNYYGVQSYNHMYLDLSGFTSWENGNAKFAIYFAYPNSNNESRWSLSNSSGGYYSSFCWKVNGQTNNHLYECIVPAYSNNSCLWNLVIAVRFDPVQGEPGWYNAWNQTQNLSFNSGNHNANMIRINDWDNGQLDTVNIISRQTRVEFFGRYFLDTVSCSGNGNSDSTTSSMWEAVKNEYVYHLTTDEQGDVWTCAGDEEGSLVAQAMARYDYIIFFKEYNHEDFINRQDSSNKTEYSSIKSVILSNNSNFEYSWLVIMIIALGSITCVLGLVVIKKRKIRGE